MASSARLTRSRGGGGVAQEPTATDRSINHRIRFMIPPSDDPVPERAGMVREQYSRVGNSGEGRLSVPQAYVITGRGLGTAAPGRPSAGAAARSDTDL